MKKLLLVALSTFAMSANAWEPSYYAGSSLAFWQYERGDLNTDFAIQSLEGVVGVTLTPYTSIEARGGFGLNTSGKTFWFYDAATDTDVATDVELEMPYFGSVYFKPHLTNEKASLYGLLGMSMVSTEFSVDDNNAVLEDETSAVSYGVGVSFVINPNFDFTAEWKKLVNADDFDMRGGSVGFVYRF